MKNIRFLLLYTVILPGISCAQQDAKVVRTKTYHDLLVTFGITDSVQQKLKGRGFDIQSELDHPTHPPESFRVLMCDVAIVGKVKAVTDMPAPQSEPFHSKAVIAVDEVLKGTVGDSEDVEILQTNGPLSDQPGAVQKLITEPPAPDFRPGQEAIFFLERPHHSPYLQSPWMQEKYHDYFKRKGSRFAANVFWIDNSTHMMTIENGRVFIPPLPDSISKPLDEVIQNIKETVKLLEN